MNAGVFVKFTQIRKKSLHKWENPLVQIHITAKQTEKCDLFPLPVDLWWRVCTCDSSRMTMSSKLAAQTQLSFNFKN